MNADWNWVQVLTTLAGVYALGIAMFLIRENRSPQSTFAWLFLMLLFPVGGLLVYTLFGRGWKAFSRKGQLHTLMEGTSLAERRTALLDRQPALLEALAEGATGEYSRLGHMLWASARAPLTTANSLEILQNATESTRGCSKTSTPPPNRSTWSITSGPLTCSRKTSHARWRTRSRPASTYAFFTIPSAVCRCSVGDTYAECAPLVCGCIRIRRSIASTPSATAVIEKSRSSMGASATPVA